MELISTKRVREELERRGYVPGLFAWYLQSQRAQLERFQVARVRNAFYWHPSVVDFVAQMRESSLSPRPARVPKSNPSAQAQ